MPTKITPSAVKITEKHDHNVALIIDSIDSDSIIVTVSNSGSRCDGDSATESMIMEWDDVRALIDALTALADEYDSENDDDDGTSGADDDSCSRYMPETDFVSDPNDGLRTVSTTTTTTTTTVRERPR